jgi:hypothetical protein
MEVVHLNPLAVLHYAAKSQPICPSRIAVTPDGSTCLKTELTIGIIPYLAREISLSCFTLDNRVYQVLWSASPDTVSKAVVFETAPGYVRGQIRLFSRHD